MNRDCDRVEKACFWDCRKMAAQHVFKMHVPVCAWACAALAIARTHTHIHTHTKAHRWQRNLAEALICRLDAGLSSLLAATLCYRFFSTTLRLITFTWRGQLTDNIVKTFLLLEGLGKHYVGQYRRRAMLYARGHEQETHTHTRIGMKRQRNRSTLFSSLSPRHQQYEYCDSWDAFMSKVIRGGSKTVTHTHTVRFQLQRQQCIVWKMGEERMLMLGLPKIKCKLHKRSECQRLTDMSKEYVRKSISGLLIPTFCINHDAWLL